MADIRPNVEEPRAVRGGLAALVASCAEPLPAFDDPAFGRLFDRFGDARVVLLGAASLGTAEFVEARAAITRWLIEARGFNIVALEADSSDVQGLDARVRGRAGAKAPPGFEAFPAWAWRNRPFEAFTDWLADRNAGRRSGEQATILGLDLYDTAGAMEAAIEHLERAAPDAAEAARGRYGGLSPWAAEPATARAAITGRYAGCEGAVTARLQDRLRRRLDEADAAGGATKLDAARAARLIREAEAHYRTLYYGGAEAWNARARHMLATLEAALAAQGPDARAVVWAHNAQAGDACATEMGAVRDMVSLGRLCRERWGEDARLIGLGTHTGRTACAPHWGAPMEVKELRPSLADSHEQLSHQAGVKRFLLDLRPGENRRLRRALSEPRLERFIGAAYWPENERAAHYADCRLSEQFDAWVWFDETTPLAPAA